LKGLFLQEVWKNIRFAPQIILLLFFFFLLCSCHYPSIILDTRCQAGFKILPEMDLGLQAEDTRFSIKK